MVKDEDLCVHCGLCAERCPTAAWDMQKSELLTPYVHHEAEGRPPRGSLGKSKAGTGTKEAPVRTAA